MSTGGVFPVSAGPAFALLLAAALAAQQPAKPDSQTAPTQTGAISGVITDGTTGRALGGVVVSLIGTDVRVSLSTVTDSKGRFVFPDLPASDRYYLSATRSGYIAGGLVRRSPLASTPFALAENEWIADANVSMWRPGGISGTVVDERGEPVVDIPVRVLTRIPIAGNTHWATGALARTDDRGFYRIAGLWPGTYVVNVPSVQSTVPPGTSHATVAGRSPAAVAMGAPLPKIAGIDVGGSWMIVGQYATPSSNDRQAYPVLYYPGVRTLTEAAPMVLTAGEEKRSIDFALRPVPTARISGRVIGPPDVVANLVVRLLQEGVEAIGAGGEQATALAGANGTFTLVGVPAGRYVLEARTGFAELNAEGSAHLPATPGFVSLQSFTFLSWLPTESLSAIVRTRFVESSEAYSARLPVTVGSDDVSDLTVVLERAATISGRIVRDDGAPLPASRIANAWVEPANGDPALGGQITDPEDGRRPAGAFTVRGLHRGQYFLRAAGGNLRVKSIVAPGGDYTNRPFDVAPGTDITDVVVTFTEQAADVSGAVRNRQGATVREGAVILFPTDRARWTNFGRSPFDISAVYYFGKGYRIARLRAGEYFIIAVDPSMQDAWQDPRFFPAAAPLATRITLAWGASAVQDLVLQQVILR